VYWNRYSRASVRTWPQSGVDEDLLDVRAAGEPLASGSGSALDVVEELLLHDLQQERAPRLLEVVLPLAPRRERDAAVVLQHPDHLEQGRLGLRKQSDDEVAGDAIEGAVSEREVECLGRDESKERPRSSSGEDHRERSIDPNRDPRWPNGVAGRGDPDPGPGAHVEESAALRRLRRRDQIASYPAESRSVDAFVGLSDLVEGAPVVHLASQTTGSWAGSIQGRTCRPLVLPAMERAGGAMEPCAPVVPSERETASPRGGI
jgi:hypothetical protein